MIVAARSGVLSLLVHGVDGAGALCGTTPEKKWRVSGRLPISCPRCLLRLGTVRWALCETPTASSAGTAHIRRVGPEGVDLGGNAAGSSTLCQAPVGWDLEELRSPARLDEERRLCGVCGRIYANPALTLTRAGVSAQR